MIGARYGTSEMLPEKKTSAGKVPKISKGEFPREMLNEQTVPK